MKYFPPRARQRSWILAAVAGLLLPFLLLTGVVGGGRELLEMEGSADLGRVFRFSDGSLVFNVLDDRSDQEILEFGQRLLAGQGEISRAAGFIVQGRPYWLVAQVYDGAKGQQEVYRRARDPAHDPTAALLDFVATDWDSLYAGITSGSLPPAGSAKVELDGRWFQMQIWDLAHPRYGTIHYFAGVVISAEPAVPGQKG